MANVRIDQVDLVGGDRSIRFEGDLSVVKGSITTGKTTVVRLLRALLGRVPHHLPPETGGIRSLRGRVHFDNETWEIDRPLVETKTAVVSLSRREEAVADEQGVLPHGWHKTHHLTEAGLVENQFGIWPVTRSRAAKLADRIARHGHGHEQTYSLGCRCDPCKVAHRERQRSDRARKRGHQP